MEEGRVYLVFKGDRLQHPAYMVWADADRHAKRCDGYVIEASTFTPKMAHEKHVMESRVTNTDYVDPEGEIAKRFEDIEARFNARLEGLQDGLREHENRLLALEHINARHYEAIEEYT